jgi:perosamine synthetase
MKDFVNLSQQRQIPLIEDCAQAHGTEYDGRQIGSFGAAGCFSFFATKHITTCGEGGIIVTDDAEVAETSRILRSHGMVDRDRHVVLGFNNRMSEIEAAMGRVQLKRLDELNAKRIANSEYLLNEISKLPWAKTTPKNERVKHTYFWCPLMVDEDKTDKNFEELKIHFQKNGIGFRQRYQAPLYKQEVLKGLGLDYSEVYLPNVEAVAGKILGLPNHPGLSQQELDRIVEVLKSF